MCFRSAQHYFRSAASIIKQDVAPSQNTERTRRASTCAGGAPGGQLQLEPERFSALNTNQLQEIHKQEKAEQKQKPSQLMSAACALQKSDVFFPSCSTI